MDYSLAGITFCFLGNTTKIFKLLIQHVFFPLITNTLHAWPCILSSHNKNIPPGILSSHDKKTPPTSCILSSQDKNNYHKGSESNYLSNRTEVWRVQLHKMIRFYAKSYHIRYLYVINYNFVITPQVFKILQKATVWQNLIDIIWKNTKQYR